MAQLTFVTPVETESGVAGSNAWAASDEGGIAPESIRESLAPGEVLVEPSIVPDLAARPRGTFLAATAAAQAAHPAVVRVVAADFGGASLGSGTLVDVNDEHGLVVTNWHVVRDAPGNVIVVFPDGFQSLGRVLRMDAHWDLAAILINKPRAAPVRLAAQAPQIGETLTIAGYGGGSYRAAAGACTQYLAPSVQHPQELVELAASARQGDSGGPIFNARGELAGVLFGEAGGRTTGAYCGRVHSFLAAAVKELYQRDGSQLAVQASRAPSQPPPSVASANGGMPGVSPRSDASQQESVAATAPEYWQNPRTLTPSNASHPGQLVGPKPAQEPLAIDSLRGAAETRDSTEPPAPASFYASTPLRDEPTDSHPARMAPVASIEPAARPNGAAFAPLKSEAAQAIAAEGAGPASVAKRDERASAAAESGSLTWELFAGETLIAQVKTVLACVGIIAILFHGARAVSASGAKASAKRGRK